MFFSNFFRKLKRFFSRSTDDTADVDNTQKDQQNTEQNNTMDNKTDQHKPVAKTSPQTTSETITRARSVHQVNSITEMSRAIKNAIPRDTIIITRAGRYGKIRLTNKSQLTIKALNADMPIEASFFIDGNSHQITIENMLLWHNIANAAQIIISAKTTHSIIIQHCVLSTVAVKRNTMLNAYAGHPRSWNNGIRMLGNNGQIINNNFLNLNLPISQTGPNTLVTHNHIQFYSEDAIRVSHHGVTVEHNTIYDSVIKRAGQNAHKDAIQLIPPENHFNAGALNNITITGNIIQSNSSAVPHEQHGIVQGIVGSDGHFVNPLISDNIIAVNSDHGITLNGVKNARIINNRILDQTPDDQFLPGIKLYLTRISQSGKQSWLANLSYSVFLDNNQAPLLNVPDEAYAVEDTGNQRIQMFSHHLTRGNSPTIIRNTRSVMTRSFTEAQEKEREQTTLKEATPKQVDTTSKEEKTDKLVMSIPDVKQKNRAIDSKDTPATTHAPETDKADSIHLIHNKTELKRILAILNDGDTLLIQEAGYYGTIRLKNKKNIRLKAIDNYIAINAGILIEGTSSHIHIENMNLWYSESNWKPVILSTPSTQHIQIKNCLISSIPVSPNDAAHGNTTQISQWITGIWLRGKNHHIENNHLVHVSTGITACSRHTLIKNNRIQFYTDIAIRVFHHDIQVQHNHIYDAIHKPHSKKHHSIAIQLVPPKDRFASGKLKNITLSDNTIELNSTKATVAKNLQGHLKGIVGQDGYMIDVLINNNTIISNTKHGIVLHGVFNLTLNDNKVIDKTDHTNDNDPYQGITGIRIYYTRTIDLNTRQQQWHYNRPYSINYRNNLAPLFNIPDQNYALNDQGDNQFEHYTHQQGRGQQPIIVP